MDVRVPPIPASIASPGLFWLCACLLAVAWRATVPDDRQAGGPATDGSPLSQPPSGAVTDSAAVPPSGPAVDGKSTVEQPDPETTDASLRPAVDCKVARLCDDFEAYPSGTKPGGTWSVSGAVNSLVVDSTRAFSGTKSVLIKLPASANAQAFMSPPSKSLFPLKDNILFGRMMVFLPISPGPD